MADVLIYAVLSPSWAPPPKQCSLCTEWDFDAKIGSNRRGNGLLCFKLKFQCFFNVLSLTHSCSIVLNNGDSRSHQWDHECTLPGRGRSDTLAECHFAASVSVLKTSSNSNFHYTTKHEETYPHLTEQYGQHEVFISIGYRLFLLLGQQWHSSVV